MIRFSAHQTQTLLAVVVCEAICSVLEFISANVRQKTTLIIKDVKFYMILNIHVSFDGGGFVGCTHCFSLPKLMRAGMQGDITGWEQIQTSVLIQILE